MSLIINLKYQLLTALSLGFIAVACSQLLLSHHRRICASKLQMPWSSVHRASSIKSLKVTLHHPVCSQAQSYASLAVSLGIYQVLSKPIHTYKQTEIPHDFQTKRSMGSNSGGESFPLSSPDLSQRTLDVFSWIAGAWQPQQPIHQQQWIDLDV